MNIWLCSPAWRRYEVTRLALAQRRWLCDTLAARGFTANAVVVADDNNLQIADEYGFPTVELDNSDLGEKFNAGYLYAADHGADVIVHIGSDDWLHPDAFDILNRVDLTVPPPIDLDEDGFAVWSDAPTIVAHRRLTLVDLVGGKAQRCYLRGSYGCIPWMIPRAALATDGFKPIRCGLTRGIDGSLVGGMSSQPNWIFQDDAAAEWCVDFKSDVNVTSYASLIHAVGDGPEEDPWPALARFYPNWLIDMARTIQL